MRTHINTLGHAFRFYGTLHLLILLAAFPVAALALWASGAPVEAYSMLALFPVGSVVALPYFIVGNGLLARKRWARMAAIVLSFLVMTDLPIGLLLGLLGVGVLFDDEVKAEFEGTLEAPVLTRNVRRVELA